MREIDCDPMVSRESTVVELSIEDHSILANETVAFIGGSGRGE